VRRKSIAMTEPEAQEAASVRVDLGARSYDIEIGPGLLTRAGDMIVERLGRRHCAVITDANVARLHLDALEASLTRAGLEHDAIVMPPGEATKSFQPLAEACERLLDLGIERGDLVVAFGGGVIGDFAGFAASILRRGVAFVQIPTTLLSQVDSSVGGKTGIDMPQGKNLIGTFHQPSLVVIDTDVLATLPARELAAGYAEVVKYGLIDDEPFFNWLEDHGKRVLSGDDQARIHAVATSCRAKARVVSADERESGKRALLNLGHTFGHALESWAGYDGALLHGEAIAIGMVMAFELSERLGYCPPGNAARVERHFRAAGLPTRIRDIADIRDDEGPSPEQLLKSMAQDKKVQAGRLVFIMARGIGASFIDKQVPVEALTRYLEEQC
jgi:3-dehydroquinate synthase